MKDNTGKSRYGILIAAVCFAVYFIGNYMQYQLSPLAATVMKELSLNESQYSSIFTANLFPAIFLSLISGLLVDRFGPRITVGLAVVLAAVGGIGRVFASSYGVMWISMLLSGLGCLFLTSSSAKILFPWFSAAQLGGVVGVVTAGSNVGMFVATATTAWFPGTRSAYVFSAVLGVLLAACWFLFVRKQDNGDAEAIRPAPILESLRVCLKNRYVWIAGVTMFFLLIAQVVTSGFLPVALQAVHGMTEKVSGYMTSAFMLGAIAGSALGPRLLNRVRNRRIYLLASILVAGLCIAFSWKISSPVPLAVVLLIGGAALNQFIPIVYAFPVSVREIGPTYSATATGLIATIEMIGATQVPARILTPIFGSNYGGLLISAGCICLLAMITINFLPLFGKEA
ncbi:MAG: MFS transporter [Oscillospiraceae bacterium]|nr:MFS transporter [Oscillospiraceae bacterium]